MPKITFSHNFLWVNFRRNFTFLLGLCLSIFIFNFNTAAVFAVQTPTLSVSVDNAAVNVNGNQVINSVNGTTELPLNLTINTTNKTGYTATLNTETNETALVNSGSASGAKIDSITGASSILSLPVNTWGFKTSNETNYNPIPSLATPTNIFQTTEKTNGNDVRGLNIGMKLGQNIESGSYDNKLIFSVITNPGLTYAKFVSGVEFANTLAIIDTAPPNVYGFSVQKYRTNHIKRSNVLPENNSITIKNIQSSDSDYEIKAWLNTDENTIYYWSQADRILLNEDASEMFSNFPVLKTIDFSTVETTETTNMSRMFSGLEKLEKLDVTNFDTSNVTNMSSMFTNLYKIDRLDLSNFNTSNVVDMGSMFFTGSSALSNLKTLIVSSFNTKKVIRMRNMFFGLAKVEQLDVSSFDTGNVTDMISMFDGMASVTELDVSRFKTEKVTDMSNMFHYLCNLRELNVSSFNTSNVTNMHSMFDGTKNLKHLDLSMFDTGRVEYMSRMFAEMNSLIELDISSFNTSKVSNFNEIFALESLEDDALEHIYVNNDFNTTSIMIPERRYSSDMFKNRKKLRGGNGSYVADPSTADKTWLRVDRPGVHGYFTRKP